MKCLFFAFLLTLCFVFTNIQCNIKSNISDRTIQKIFKDSLVNNSYSPLMPFKKIGFDSEKEEIRKYEGGGKNCLKNITACMEKDLEYRLTTDKLFDFISSSLPPFDLSQFKEVSNECKRQSQIYIEGLKKFKFWALKMYDSTAKMPSGILNGNVNQFGDFDICLDANSENENIFGQYCLSSLEVQIPRSSYLAGLHQLMQSHYHFQSRLEDPGHRVPRFSSINWALCVPSACTAEDVEIGLRETVEKVLQDTEIEIRYEVKPSMCQTKTSQKRPMSTNIAIIIFASIILWELIATVYDFWAIADKNKIVMAFSLRKNINSMLSIERSSDDISAVHGVRCLNSILLLLSHKSLALFFLPFANRTEFVEYISRPFSVLGRAASLYTDPFIMISGTLTTYALLGKLNKTHKINILEEYVSRLFRILPSFAALIAFCTFILPWASQGPLWNLVVTQHSDICKQNWWRNILFIHNYFGFSNMCLTHTHHIGIDTQLFFASPFLIYILWKWPKRGGFALIFTAALSTFARYYVTYTQKLSNYIHFGTSIQQLFATADNMYILPVHRATVYIMGILLGYVLKNYSQKNLTKLQLSIGNTLALLTFCISFFGPSYMSTLHYVYDPFDGAWYAAIAPILWCFTFAWIIYTTQLGYKGLLGRLATGRFCILWTKISYTVYLTQFPVYFYNVGTTRSTAEYGFFGHMFNFNEYFWVILVSILLTLTFELPFQNLRGILVKRKNYVLTNSDISKKIS